MFSRLASLNEGFDDATNQQTYNQQISFNQNVGNIIYTDSPLQPPVSLQDSVSSLNTTNDPDIIKLFSSYYTADPKLVAQNKPCADAQKIDDIMNNPAGENCGWFYTPPQGVSWAPKFSKGWLATPAGPVSVGSDTPTPYQYDYFYHDKLGDGQRLADGKQKILEDFCSSAKTCTDVQSSVYKGICGWCPEGMSVPINPDGSIMYPKKGIACTNIVTSADKCPQPANNAVLDPNACVGPFSRGCIQNILTGMNCDKGSLNLALTGSFNPSNTNINSGTISTIPSMNLYNQHADTPINISRFLGISPGAAKQDSIAEVMKIANSATSQAPDSAVGASARDLCLMPGAIDQYNFCDDLSTKPSGGWPTTCLQQAFRKAGGTPNGTGFPTPTTTSGQKAINSYNTFSNWSDVYNSMLYMYELARGVVTEGFTTTQPQARQGFVDYEKNIANTNTQASAIKIMIGIDAAKLGVRVPPVPGVEVFWKNGYRIVGYSVEPQIPVISGSTYSKVLPGVVANNFIALTDMRSKAAVSAIIQSTADYGHKTGASLNGPVTNINSYNNNATGNVVQLNYTTNANILTVQWFGSNYPNDNAMVPSNNQGNWKLNQQYGNGQKEDIITSSTVMVPSITREATGPFIMLEMMYYNGVNTFCDLRLPGLLEGLYQPTFFSNGAQALGAPGTNGYMTLKGDSNYQLFNVMMNCIGQLTIAFRVTSISKALPNYLFSFSSNDDNNNTNGILCTIMNDGTIQIGQQRNASNTPVGSNLPFNLNEWTLCTFTNYGANWTIAFKSIAEAITTNSNWANWNSRLTPTINSYGGSPLASSSPQAHGLTAGISPTIINIKLPNNNTAFNMDVAWIHMFDKALGGADLQREAKNNWMFTKAQS
jgi:hypothetical protein